jgi:hypothetical protein
MHRLEKKILSHSASLSLSQIKKLFFSVSDAAFLKLSERESRNFEAEHVCKDCSKSFIVMRLQNLNFGVLLQSTCPCTWVGWFPPVCAYVCMYVLSGCGFVY